MSRIMAFWQLSWTMKARFSPQSSGSSVTTTTGVPLTGLLQDRQVVLVRYCRGVIRGRVAGSPCPDAAGAFEQA